jgi:hypothetical protein
MCGRRPVDNTVAAATLILSQLLKGYRMFPITITLHDALQLNAVMAALALPSEAPEKSQVKPKPATTVRSPRTAEAAADVAPEQSTAKPEPQPDTAKAATASSAADVVDYPTLQKAVAKLFAKDAKAPVQIAKDLGFDTFKAMPADAWGKALDAVNSKLAELEIA